MLQYLRHKIRMEVEKSAFALIEGQPELKEISEHVKSLKLQDSPEIKKEDHLPHNNLEEQKHDPEE